MKNGQIKPQEVRVGQIMPQRPKTGQIMVPVQPKPKLMY